MQRFLKITASGLVLWTASICQATTYPEPEITSLMFHVDKLPLDHDSMKDIAKDLVILASRNPYGDQQRLNSNAKLIAIAMRLDSKNQDAKKLSASFRNNENITEPGPDTLLKAQGKILNIIGVLSKAEKYAEAHTFADYLKDAMLGITRDQPVLVNHEVNEKRWKNIVPEVVDAPPVRPQQPEKLEANMPDGIDPKVTPEANPKPDEGQKPSEVVPAKWNILTSEITSPVVLEKTVDEKPSRYWHVSPFKLTLKPTEGTGNVNLLIKPSYDEGKRKQLESILKQMLTLHWKLFQSIEVRLELPGTYSDSSGKLGLLPIYTQLYASLKDRAIPSGMNMLGELKSDGSILRSDLFWVQLKQLRKVEALGQTLFCPVSVEKDLQQLVALEESEFFIRNEVVLVKDIEEASKYFGEITDLDLKFAHEEFVKLRDLVGSRSIGSFSVDKKFIASLEKIITLNPNHMSAKMILLRGDTRRSSKIDPYFVAEEFKALINSLHWVYEKKSIELDSSEMARKADIIDEQLELIARYIDRSEATMTNALEEMSDELNNLSRALKKKDSDYHVRSARVAHDRFKEHYQTAVEYIKVNQKTK